MNAEPKKEANFAENQARWDRGEVSLDGCCRKGREHAAYGWSANGLGFPASAEQQEAYERGWRDGRASSSAHG